MNYWRELLFRIAVWTMYTRSIFSLVLLNFFWTFWTTSRKSFTQKQLFSGVLQGRRPENFAKLNRKHQCSSYFFKKSPEVKRLKYRYFFVNFAKLLRTPFSQNVPESHRKSSIAGVHRKIFGWLVANELLA